MRNIIATNKSYREETGNDWMCLTSNGLIGALDATDDHLQELIQGALASVPREHAGTVRQLSVALERQRLVEIEKCKAWFLEHYDSLLYDMSGKVPWSVVRRLRRNLSVWIIGLSNPFDQRVEEMVTDVAREHGIFEEDPEKAWIAMGGMLFLGRDC